MICEVEMNAKLAIPTGILWVDMLIFKSARERPVVHLDPEEVGVRQDLVGDERLSRQGNAAVSEGKNGKDICTHSLGEELQNVVENVGSPLVESLISRVDHEADAVHMRQHSIKHNSHDLCHEAVSLNASTVKLVQLFHSSDRKKTNNIGPREG